jgi:hypothetical protein
MEHTIRTKPVTDALEAFPTQARAAATELKNFLKDGKRSASECHAFLKRAGYSVEVLNFGRVRKMADIGHYQEAGQSWWFLGAPIRAAATALKTFLKDGERLATECREHLFTSAGFNGDEKELWFVRNCAGATVTEKDGQSWWSVSAELVEFAESFDDFFLEEGSEFLEETTWQTS